MLLSYALWSTPTDLLRGLLPARPIGSSRAILVICILIVIVVIVVVIIVILQHDCC